MKQVERMRIMHAITFSRGSPGSRMSRSMAWRMRGNARPNATTLSYFFCSRIRTAPSL